MMELEIGKEYWIQQRYAILEAIEGNTAVCRDRWDFRFECDIGEVLEKPSMKPLPKKKN